MSGLPILINQAITATGYATTATLKRNAPLDLPAEMIAPCYRALRKIFNILYAPDLRLTFKLKAGEGLVFNNQRILHGRTAFTAEQPPRSVLTSSVDIEEFYSSLRMLQVSLGHEGPQMAYSQGMTG